MKYAQFYKEVLLNNIIPFWEQHSIDHENGGYFTCLTIDGKVYDSDKFLWLQGRQAWMFSMLYNNVEKNNRWLSIAKSGVDFIRDHGMDTAGNFYFSTNQQGKPLIAPYNIFSDCFAAMAFSQYSKAAKDKNYEELAKKTYRNILKKRTNPKGSYEKSTGNRPLKSFALPMILSNLVLELEHLLDPTDIEQTLDQCIHEVMTVFLDNKSGLIYENVNPDGSLNDSFDGRLLNPGHGIEAMWFMMDIGKRRNDQGLINSAIEIILRILEYSWDEKYGGIFYFMDSKGYPPQQLEWDQKLWWVHLETLVALSKAMEHNADKRIKEWYEKVHLYSWSKFHDPKNGEWFGYLNRQGEILLNLKGGKWKGCFHAPRAMYQCWQSFENLQRTN